MLAAMRRASSGVNTFACRRRVCVQICTDSVAPASVVSLHGYHSIHNRTHGVRLPDGSQSNRFRGLSGHYLEAGDDGRALRKVVREQRDEIVRRVRIGTA
jgi:hypothetical protein